MTAPDGTPVKTTANSLTLLSVIRENGGASISELAEAVGMAKSSVHRHLETLEWHGFVRRSGENYHLGLKFLDLGEYVRSQWPLKAINETVKTLSEATGEEVDFLTEDRGRVMTIDKSYRKYHKLVKYGEVDEPVEDENYRAQFGNYYYMHVTGAGKAILAELPEPRVEAIIDRWGLPSMTENTITAPEALRDELEQIRAQGYAVTDEEYAEGLRSVAQVVHNPNGGVFGALNVAGPTYRMDGVVVDREIPNALETACADLEEKLDGDSPIARRQPLYFD